mgnify:FL=1
MKRNTVSFFRLSLVIIGYIIYNSLFYFYPSGEYPSFTWPFLVISWAFIAFGNLFLLIDPIRLMVVFKEDRNIRNSTIIQLVLVIVSYFIQSAELMKGQFKFINFINHFSETFALSLILTLIFIIAIYQKLWLHREDNNDAKYHFVFGLLLIVITNILLVSTAFSTISAPTLFNSGKNYPQEFKDFGLNGTVKVKSKKHAFELRGYEVSLEYTEQFSDGYSYSKNYTIPEEAGDQYELAISNESVQKIKELLSTDKERERLEKVKYEEFNFLLSLYKEKLKKLKVPYTITNTINTAFKVELVKETRVDFYPTDGYEFTAFLISESLRNVEKGDLDAAGFYNIDVKKAMQNEQIYANIEFIFYFNLSSKAQKAGLSNLEYFKEVLESLPRGTFWDGVYRFKGSADVNGKTRDVISTFVVENGIGYFEEDELK